MKRYVLLLLLLLAANGIQAQLSEFYNAIPTSKNINITLTYCDSTTLPYYNLYSFDYFDGTDTVAAEMLVPKKEDMFHKELMVVNTQLCRITTFYNTISKDKHVPLKVNDYIEVIRNQGKDTLFLNFDPLLPHPVLTPCNSK
ncbi:MAG: hypothetical protein R2800_15190 [Flavipsychrobacter sp.]